MAQTSLPILNRSGIFSYWNSMWDSQFNYPYYLTRFNFLDLFFLKFFKGSLFTFNFIKLKHDDMNKKIFFFKNFKKKTKISNFNKNTKNYLLNSSKLWILKFNNWLILSIYLFDSSFKLKKKKKKINIKLKKKVNSLFLKNLNNKSLLILFKTFFKRSWKFRKTIQKKFISRYKFFYFNKMQFLTKKLNRLTTLSIFKKKKIKINLKTKTSLFKKYYQFNKPNPKKFFYKITKTLTSYYSYTDFNIFYKNFKN